MTDIPEAWPPTPDDRPARVVPLFPLSGVFLLPRQIMPLHIFEPRYRQMIDDVLDAQGRVALGTVVSGTPDVQTSADEDVDEQPPRILPVAGLGEIARHEKTPDGRYFIWLFGLGRFDVDEVPSDRMYRRVSARAMEQTEVDREIAVLLEAELREALTARSDEPLTLPEDVPIELLADALAQKLHLPQSAMEPIFCEPDVERRARMTLRAHNAFPPPSFE